MLISVIIPAYNAEAYIAEAIESVLKQTWNNWELLIINDGSKDSTEEVIQAFLGDTRIRYFSQENKGVSAARNVGLAHMNGEYFCFLDADDLLPPQSLSSRLEVFQSNSKIRFVDGSVETRDSLLKGVSRIYTPSFPLDNPLSDLIQLTGHSFFGLSWMLKREPNQRLRFNESLTHSEDLLFYMELARAGGLYACTKDIIYIYRNSSHSAMSNLEGLEKGYWCVYEIIRSWQEVRKKDLWVYKMKVKKIMFLSFLNRGAFIKAIRAIVR